ncbi:MAG: MFS transporter [Bryobacterales bacterium]|nr:MFS transporter [Bryobacterales bacterium]
MPQQTTLSPQCASGSSRWTPWLLLAMFWLVYFLNHADRQIVFSVFPLLKTELNLSNTQLGLLGSSFQWVYACLVPVAGFLGDFVSRKRIIVSALLLWSLTTVSSGLVTGFALLLLLRALTGAGEAFYYPSATSIIADYHGEKTRALAMSIHQTSLYFGVVVSGTLAGYLGEQFGWRSAFLVFGVAGVAAAAMLMRFLREPQRGGADSSGAQTEARDAKSEPSAAPTSSVLARLKTLCRTPSVLALAGSFCGMSFASVAIVTWMPAYIYGLGGFSLAEAGFHATFYHQLGAFAGVLAGGALADRFAARSPLSRPLVQAAGLLLSVPFLYWIGSASSATALFVALGVFGIFRGIYDSNLFASLFEVVAPETRATATGLMLSMGFLVGGTSPVVIGNLSQQFGLGPSLGATSVCYLAAGLLMLANIALWFQPDSARMKAALAR